MEAAVFIPSRATAPRAREGIKTLAHRSARLRSSRPRGLCSRSRRMAHSPTVSSFRSYPRSNLAGMFNTRRRVVSGFKDPIPKSATTRPYRHEARPRSVAESGREGDPGRIGLHRNRDDACAIRSQRGENMKNHKIYPAMLLVAGLVATPVSAQVRHASTWPPAGSLAV
jgi:hypothetical protein